MSSGAAMYMPSLPAANCCCSVPQARPCVALIASSVNRRLCSACRIATASELSKLATGVEALSLTIEPPTALMYEEKCQPPLFPAL